MAFRTIGRIVIRVEPAVSVVGSIYRSCQANDPPMTEEETK
uniref:Uncharacterized protein n=1 Tax=Rhizophora mucronata TaxID=61149 RepID=A0A2P2IS79_RHIMU